MSPVVGWSRRNRESYRDKCTGVEITVGWTTVNINIIFTTNIYIFSKPAPGFEVSDLHRKGRHVKVRPNKNPLGFDTPFAKGVVIKSVIKKPKKPNSANRKVSQSWKKCPTSKLIFSVRLSETLQWTRVDFLRARRGSQPAGAQCCPHQSGQTAGCARSEDQVCPRKV